mmetsp:Transcript_65474/g.211113  ORF Transcript_65474/g.211113 Transcript_65474/m.211113 type:complete len:449 (-) Transcript_65474:67-1413(-)
MSTVAELLAAAAVVALVACSWAPLLAPAPAPTPAPAPARPPPQPPLVREQFDFATWTDKFPSYALSNPSVDLENVTARIAWADKWADFEPFSNMPFTPSLACEGPLSRLMDRFDLKIYPKKGWDGSDCRRLDDTSFHVESRKDDPDTVWAAPNALDFLLDLAERNFDASRAHRLVVFLGSEYPLSVAFGNTHEQRVATVARLKKYFGRIVYQTKDIRLEGVSIAPMGFSWGYTSSLVLHWLALRDPYRSFSRWAENVWVRTSVHSKTRGILAAYGHAAGWLEWESTAQNVHGMRGLGRQYPPSNSSLEAVAAAGRSRKFIRTWARSRGARDANVEHAFPLGFLAWWEELPKYRFIVNPIGSAIQTAKTIEALYVLVVPIIKRDGFPTFDELVRLGFPLVLIDSWEEITQDNSSIWWNTLAPRLTSFRRNCISIESWWRMYTGQLKFCA